MPIVKIALAAAALIALAGTAGAATTRLNDAQYVAASHCLGLMESKSLGSPDVTAMKAVVEAQTFGREDLAREQADEARSGAENRANHASGDMKARLIAERDGACKAWLPATQTSAVAATTHTD